MCDVNMITHELKLGLSFDLIIPKRVFRCFGLFFCKGGAFNIWHRVQMIAMLI